MSTGLCQFNLQFIWQYPPTKAQILVDTDTIQAFWWILLYFLLLQPCLKAALINILLLTMDRKTVYNVNGITCQQNHRELSIDLALILNSVLLFNIS